MRLPKFVRALIGLSPLAAAKITDTKPSYRKSTWDDPFGQRRTVPDRFRELRLELN